MDRVPILGSIPLLGHLFRSSGKAREKTNLMTFLRTTIVRTSEDANRVTAQQYKSLQGLDGEGIGDIDVNDILKFDK